VESKKAQALSTGSVEPQFPEGGKWEIRDSRFFRLRTKKGNFQKANHKRERIMQLTNNRKTR